MQVGYAVLYRIYGQITERDMTFWFIIRGCIFCVLSGWCLRQIIRRYYKFKVLAGSWHGGPDGSFPCISDETQPLQLRLAEATAPAPSIVTKSVGTIVLQWAADPQVSLLSFLADTTNCQPVPTLIAALIGLDGRSSEILPAHLPCVLWCSAQPTAAQHGEAMSLVQLKSQLLLPTAHPMALQARGSSLLT